VLGVNAARDFRNLKVNPKRPSKHKVKVRPPDTASAEQLVGQVVAQSAAGSGVDNITLSAAMLHLAKMQHAVGDTPGARRTLDTCKQTFAQMNLATHVLNRIAKAVKSVALPGAAGGTGATGGAGRKLAPKPGSATSAGKISKRGKSAKRPAKGGNRPAKATGR
jgi:hypothetical protein